MRLFLFLLVKDLFIYGWVFVAAFSNCREQGLLFIAMYQLLIAVASIVSEHRL